MSSSKLPVKKDEKADYPYPYFDQRFSKFHCGFGMWFSNMVFGIVTSYF